MDDSRLISVSPRHSVRLAIEYAMMVDKPPQSDYVVHTLVRKMAGSMPLMLAELVIAGRETRERFPLADTYPFHFRKTYFRARFHGDTKDEYTAQEAASHILDIPPPIGHTEDTFRSCMLPGKAYTRISPFGAQPDNANIRIAKEVDLAAAAGLWRLCEEAFRCLTRLQQDGLTHGDAELHNFVVCPSPLETIPIDYESSLFRDSASPDGWEEQCRKDFLPLLREAIYIQCVLGAQRGPLATQACERIGELVRDPGQFLRAIERQAEVTD